jgi:hAT family C-terminal dimerisation region
MEFVGFRNRETPFQPSKWCWDHIEDPRNFWKMVSTEDSKFLRRLAMRIFATPANSVPSERAFSAQNFIHTKLRNSLHPSRVDKIVFIYMNSRVLKNQQKSSYKMSEKEKVEMEDAALLLDEIPTQEELEYQGIDDDVDDEDEDDFEDDLKMIE